MHGVLFTDTAQAIAELEALIELIGCGPGGAVRRAGAQAVRTSGAPAVMTIVCSSWAESAPSAVRTVQPSRPWRTRA